MKKTSLYFIAVLVVLTALSVWSCTRGGDGSGFEKVPEDRTVHIDLDRELGKEYSIFDFFESVEIIPLADSPAEALLNLDGYFPALFLNDRILLLDCWRSRKIWSFDYEGNWTGEPVRRGRGGNEYTSAPDMCFDPYDNTLNIVNNTGTIYKYDVRDNFRFIRKIELNLRATHGIEVAGDGMYILYSRFSEDMFLLYNEHENSMTVLDYHLPLWLRQTPFNATFPFYRDECGARCRIGHDGSIYTVDTLRNRLVPYIGWDFGKYNFPSDRITPDQDVEYYVRYALTKGRKIASRFVSSDETDGKIYLQFYFDLDPCTLIYDSRTKEYKATGRTSEGVFIGMPGHIRDGAMYAFISPQELKDYINESVLDEHGRKVLSSITEDSNWVIVKYKLK